MILVHLGVDNSLTPPDYSPMQVDPRQITPRKVSSAPVYVLGLRGSLCNLRQVTLRSLDHWHCTSLSVECFFHHLAGYQGMSYTPSRNRETGVR